MHLLGLSWDMVLSVEQRTNSRRSTTYSNTTGFPEWALRHEGANSDAAPLACPETQHVTRPEQVRFSGENQEKAVHCSSPQNHVHYSDRENTNTRKSKEQQSANSKVLCSTDSHNEAAILHLFYNHNCKSHIRGPLFIFPIAINISRVVQHTTFSAHIRLH